MLDEALRSLRKDFDVPESLCPIRGAELRETDLTDEITAIMLLLGLL